MRAERLPVFTLYQNDSGRVTKAPKIGDEVTQHKEMTVSPAILAQYAGSYKLQPGVDASITLQDAQLFIQLTGQPSLPLYLRRKQNSSSK